MTLVPLAILVQLVHRASLVLPCSLVQLVPRVPWVAQQVQQAIQEPQGLPEGLQVQLV